MIYTKATLKAMNIAYEAHRDQKDKAGYPYIFHLLHLAEQMDTEDTCVVALLHDVIEDTYMTYKDLEEAGFTKEQLDALRLLTHEEYRPGMSWEERVEKYLDYIRELKTNEIAKVVKRADLMHNLDSRRLLRKLRENDIRRLEKYQKALEILEE